MEETLINVAKRTMQIKEKEDITAKCIKCKKLWDMEIVRTRKDYEPRKCPNCGGKLERYRK